MVRKQGFLGDFGGMLGMLLGVWVWLFDGPVVVLHVACRRRFMLKDNVDDVVGGVEAWRAIRGEKGIWRARWNGDIILLLLLLLLSASVVALFLESKERQRRHLFASLFIYCLFVSTTTGKGRGDAGTWTGNGK